MIQYCKALLHTKCSIYVQFAVVVAAAVVVAIVKAVAGAIVVVVALDQNSGRNTKYYLAPLSSIATTMGRYGPLQDDYGLRLTAAFHKFLKHVVGLLSSLLLPKHHIYATLLPFLMQPRVRIQVPEHN